MRIDEKIKILFTIGGLGVGGKERQLIELIHGLPKDRFECHLLVKKHDAYYLEKILDSLDSFCSLDKSSFSILDFLTVARHVDRVKPHIVCSWTNITSHFGLLARIVTRHPYRIMNCCIRNAPVRFTATLRFERFMYSFYGCVVANSNAGLQSYGQEGKKNRFVLYNGFDLSRVPTCSKEAARQKTGFSGDKFIVVMVASLSKLKDHKTLLKASVHCRKKDRGTQFFIVGDGTERDRLQQWSRDNDCESNVTFLGKRDDVELIFRAADVSVLSSTSWFGEGISNSIIESMACGTPVIATDSPGTREVITSGENGHIIECGDDQGLAGKIIELHKNPQKIEDLSQNARKHIEEKFSINQLIETFCQIVQRCSD